MSITKFLFDSRTRVTSGYILLGLLIIQLFVITLLPRDWQRLSQEICGTLILLVLGLTLVHWRKIFIPLLITVVILEEISILLKMEILNTILMLINILLFVIIIGIYIIQTSRASKVDASVILQSINGYLLLAMISSLLIGIILNYDTGAFSFPDSFDIANITLSEVQYVGLVTISTLGYGDIYPLTPIARSVTTFIAVSGLLYIAIIIALLVGKFSNTK